MPEGMKMSNQPIRTEEASILECAKFYIQQFKNPKQAFNTLPLAIDKLICASEQTPCDDVQLLLAEAYLLEGLPQKAKALLSRLSYETLSLTQQQQANLLLFDIALLSQNTAQIQHQLSVVLQEGSLQAKSVAHFKAMAFYCNKQELAAEKGDWFPILAHALQGLLWLPMAAKSTSYKALSDIFITRLSEMMLDTEESIALLTRLFKKYPGQCTIAISIGRYHLNENQYEDALFWFKKANARNPLCENAYRALIICYEKLSETDLALETVNAWLDIYPESTEAKMVLADLYQYQPGSLPKAIELLESIILTLKDAVKKANLFTILGDLHLKQGQWNAAVSSLQAALALDDSNFQAWVKLGSIYYDQQNYTLATQVFEQALTFSPENAKILCNLGYLAWMQHDINTAIGYYHQSIAYDPTYEIALNNLGVIYLDHVGDIQQALALFEQTLSFSPEYSLSHYNKGRALSFLGLNIEAAECFKLAQEHNEKSNDLDKTELAERIHRLFETPQHNGETGYAA
jgi:tetratricopeptide (TPR) repeat protein